MQVLKKPTIIETVRLNRLRTSTASFVMVGAFEFWLCLVSHIVSSSRELLVKLIAHLNQLRSLRMCRAVPPLPHL